MPNNKKKKTLLLILIALLLIIFLCIGLFIKRPGKSKIAEDGTIVKENVTVITKDMQRDLKLHKGIEDNTLATLEEPPFKKGDILVADSLEKMSYGFIKRVVDDPYQDGNTYVIPTEPALLTDVFEELHLHKTFLFDEDGATEVESISAVGNPNSINKATAKNVSAKETNSTPELMYLSSETSKKATADLGLEFTAEFEKELDELVAVSGEANFRIYLEVQIDISKGDVEWGMALHTQTNGQANLTISDSIEKSFEEEVFSKYLGTITMYPGGVPIIITNDMHLDANGSASLSGQISSSVELGSSSANGFLYSSKTNKFQEIKEREYLSDGVTWETSYEITGAESLGLTLYLKSMIYDMCGPEFGVGLEESVTGQAKLLLADNKMDLTPVGSLDMAITPKYLGSVNVNLPIFDFILEDVTLFEKEIDLKPLWEKHWESSTDWKKKIEESETSHADKLWFDIYSNAIEEYKAQEGQENLELLSPFYESSLDVDFGQSVEGWPTINGAPIYWLLKDVSAEPDGVPELFIGSDINGKKEILAVYMITEDGIACAPLVCEINDTEGINSLYLSDGNMILKSNNNPGEEVIGGEWIYIAENEWFNFAAFRKDQDAETLIDSDTLDWKPLNKWGMMVQLMF